MEIPEYPGDCRLNWSQPDKQGAIRAGTPKPGEYYFVSPDTSVETQDAVWAGLVNTPFRRSMRFISFQAGKEACEHDLRERFKRAGIGESKGFG